MDVNQADAKHKTLFFISGTLPTDAELEAARALEGQVLFRNALVVPTDGPIENADAVAGAVPDRYKEAYDHIDDINTFRKRRYDYQRQELAANDMDRGARPIHNSNPNQEIWNPEGKPATIENVHDTTTSDVGWTGSKPTENPLPEGAVIDQGPVQVPATGALDQSGAPITPSTAASAPMVQPVTPQPAKPATGIPTPTAKPLAPKK